MANPDPNLVFLRQLSDQMRTNSEVRRLVAKAMSSACMAVASNDSDKQKAIRLGATVEEVSQEILDLF